MRDYVNHWIIGIVCFVVWSWGDKLGVNAEAIKYAALTLPIVVGHALAFTPENPSPNVQAPSGAQSVDHQPV